MNWYQKAKKSNDETIKKMLDEYDASKDDNAKRIELKNAIQTLCGGDDEEVTASFELANPFAKAESETPKNEEVEKVKGFSHTEESIKKLKEDELIGVLADCRNEIKRLEHTRLMHQTFAQKKELNSKIWKIQRIANIARGLIYSNKMQKKLDEQKTKTSLLTTKRARFVRLFRMGISFSNMLTHPDGIKKEDMLDIVNDDVIKSCTEIDQRFVEHWGRWVEVKLKP